MRAELTMSLGRPRSFSAGAAAQLRAKAIAADAARDIRPKYQVVSTGAADAVSDAAVNRSGTGAIELSREPRTKCVQRIWRSGATNERAAAPSVPK